MTLTLFLIIILVGEPIVTGGFRKVTEDGKLLAGFGRLLKMLPVNLYVPIIGCWTCMAGVWTVLLWATLVLGTSLGYETAVHLWWLILANAFTNSVLEYLTDAKSRKVK